MALSLNSSGMECPRMQLWGQGRAGVLAVGFGQFNRTPGLSILLCSGILAGGIKVGSARGWASFPASEQVVYVHLLAPWQHFGGQVNTLRCGRIGVSGYVTEQVH